MQNPNYMDEYYTIYVASMLTIHNIFNLNNMHWLPFTKIINVRIMVGGNQPPSEIRSQQNKSS